MRRLFFSNISVKCIILVKAHILLVFSYKINTSLKYSKKKKKNTLLANTSGYTVYGILSVIIFTLKLCRFRYSDQGKRN